MQHVLVEQFGGPEVLQFLDTDPAQVQPGPGQVRVKLTSVGMNQAELMGRRGEYKASTGDPPFVPGIEGGGIVESVGEGVDPARVGQRVTLAPGVPRGVNGSHGGTYRSHMLVEAAIAMPAPDAIPDEQLGAIWLPYLTAYGCLIWKHGLKPGDTVALPAASSSVALAAAQVAKHHGATVIGLTSSPSKVEKLRALPTARFDHLVVTHDRAADGSRTLLPWHRDLKALTDGKGVNVFFDPVAAGPYLSTEVRALAKHGRIYIYGLLGELGEVNLQPLIIRRGGIMTFVIDEIVSAGDDAWRPACAAIFDGFAQGAYRQHIDRTFPLSEVQAAHAYMQDARHLGKLVLIP